jgi:hypothetical protein
VLDQTFKSKWDQAKKDGNTVAAAGAWISEQQYLSKWGVRARTKAAILLGRLVYPGQYYRALHRRAEWEHALHHVFQTVDFIALPTLQVHPPAIPWFGRIALLEARVLNLQNTIAVNFAGNPALAVPVPLRHESFPVTSLQLVGPKFSEAELLNAGRLVEAGVKQSKSVGLGQRISQLAGPFSIPSIARNASLGKAHVETSLEKSTANRSPLIDTKTIFMRKGPGCAQRKTLAVFQPARLRGRDDRACTSSLA